MRGNQATRVWRSGKRPCRRGAGIAAVVMMLAMLNIAVIGSISASAQEADLGAMRAETTRAFYAAESGAVVVLKLTNEGLGLPAVGETLTLGSATAQYVSLPPSGTPGNAVIQGRSGDGARRVRVTLAAP